MPDFGDVSMGRPAVKTVRLNNTSDESMHMIGFRSTCRCARPHVAEREIEPRSFVFVPIQLDSEGRTGERSATVPFKVIQQMMQHPLTDKGLAAFLADWDKLQKAKGKGGKQPAMV